MTQTPDDLRATAQAGDNPVRLQLADLLLDKHQPHHFDPFEALYWLEQAGSDDDVTALLRAGTTWGTGLGCEAKTDIALTRFQTAATQDNSEALIALCRNRR